MTLPAAPIPTSRTVDKLELRIPPPLLFVLFATLMWLAAGKPPIWVATTPLRHFGVGLLALIGTAFSASGLLSFGWASTTIDPIHPQAASTLVTRGIYRITRNPMYVGLVLLQAAWALQVGAGLAALGVPAFAIWLHRFQVLPEERALRVRFGQSYVDYCGSVRRWL